MVLLLVLSGEPCSAQWRLRLDPENELQVNECVHVLAIASHVSRAHHSACSPTITATRYHRFDAKRLLSGLYSKLVSRIVVDHTYLVVVRLAINQTFVSSSLSIYLVVQLSTTL